MSHKNDAHPASKVRFMRRSVIIKSSIAAAIAGGLNGLVVVLADHEKLSDPRSVAFAFLAGAIIGVSAYLLRSPLLAKHAPKIAIFACILLTGCVVPHRSITAAPQIGVVKTSVERVAEKASAAKATSENVIGKVQVVYRDGAAPGSSAVAEIQSDLRQIRGDLEAALVETQNTKEQIERLRKIDAEREAAMLELRDDLERAGKALRSRTNSLLVVMLIAGGLAIYIFRTPLMNVVGFLTRKIAGVPW